MRKWSIITVIGSGLVVGLLIFSSHRDRQSGLDPNDAGSGEASGSTGIDALAVEHQTPEPPASRPGESTVSGPTSATPAAPRVWDGGAWRAGVRAFESGNYVEARAALEDAVQEQDQVPYRHYLLGLTCLRLGQPEVAAVELEVARELAPDNVRVLVNLARARLQLADPAAARVVIARAVELDSLDADAQLVAGRVSLDEGDAEAAAASFARAAELAPNQAWAWNNLGYTRILQERFGEAVDPLRTATQLRDDVGSFFNNLGVALERTGDLAGAHLAYARAGELGHAAAVASGARVDGLLIAQGVDPLRLQPSAAGAPVVGQPSDTLTTEAGLTTAARQ
jgi:Flp pilus assembly protein TadD